MQKQKHPFRIFIFKSVSIMILNKKYKNKSIQVQRSSCAEFCTINLIA